MNSIPVTVGTKTFVRGEIKDGERFFMILQEDHYLNNSSWNSIILNYYSVLRGTTISFASGEKSGDPIYFTSKVKDGKIILFVDDTQVTTQEVSFTSTKLLESDSSIYAGVWYSLFFTQGVRHIPWNIIECDKKTLNDKNNLVGSNINGFFTKNEGTNKVKLTSEKNYRYCFIPEYFKNLSENLKKSKSFPEFKNWVINPSLSSKGFTSIETDREWYEYSPLNSLGGPKKIKKGKDVYNKPSSKKREILSFSDLENEKKGNEKSPLDKFISFFTRDNGNNSTIDEIDPPIFNGGNNTNINDLNNGNGGDDDNGGSLGTIFFFIFAFLLGCIITIIISYFLSGSSSKTSQKNKSLVV